MYGYHLDMSSSKGTSKTTMKTTCDWCLSRVWTKSRQGVVTCEHVVDDRAEDMEDMHRHHMLYIKATWPTGLGGFSLKTTDGVVSVFGN